MTETKYDAFLSYSHARDKPLCAALQREMQTLGKPWWKRRALRVFRDDTSLSAAPQLWGAIEASLAASRKFVLLASPEAARSVWVDKEVAWWRANRNPDDFLVVLTAGRLVWDQAAGRFRDEDEPALPPSSRDAFASEPKWIDFTPFRSGALSGPAFRDRAADVASAVHGVGKDELVSEEMRQQKRALRLAGAAAVVLALLAGTAVWQAVEATRARDAAQRSERVAIAERDRAERNFGLARDTVNDVIFDFAQGFQQVEGVRAAVVGRVLARARASLDRLAEAAPEDRELSRSRSALLNEFGDALGRAGDRPAATAAYEESLAIARSLAAADPASLRWRRDVTVSLERLARARLAVGERAAALGLFDEGLTLRRGIAAAEPGNREYRRDVLIGLSQIADVRRSLGDAVGASRGYEEALTIARALAAEEPGAARWAREVAGNLEKLADVRMAAGDAASAAAGYGEALAISRRLASEDPTDTENQRNLSIGLNKNGTLRLIAGDHAGAAGLFGESLTIRRRLLASDPENADWRRDVSVSLNNVGRAREVAGDRAGALAAYEESLALARTNAEADPGDLDKARDLGVSLERVGSVKLASGDRAGALAVFEEGLVIDLRRAAADPSNVETANDIVVSLLKIAQAGVDPAAVRGRFAEALRRMRALDAAGQLDEQLKPLLPVLQGMGLE
jgi:tetratricopeptide (TPR) repeat protein